MRWIYSLPHRLRSLFRRSRVEDELDQELCFHIEQATAAAIDRGLDPATARRAALRSLEGMAQRKEECRDAWGVRIIDNLAQDIRYAFRTLRNSPGFTTVAILSLALGIGANTAIFSLMDALLIRPLPVPHPDSLALLSVRMPDPHEPLAYSFSYPLFHDVESRSSAFSGVFAWTSLDMQTPEGREMTILRGVYASGDYFSALGVAPEIGKTFGPEDDDPAGGKNGMVAVISDGLWKRKYGGDRVVLGKSLIIDGIPMTIVGVMPSGFFGAEVGTAPEVWIPLNASRRTTDNAACFSQSSCHFIRVMARLRPGITPGQAQANLLVISPTSMNATLRAGMRPRDKAEYLARTLRCEPGRSGYTALRRRVGNPLHVLMGLVALVLLIACANMANLLTARASARFREVGVRLAMGAGRMRVVRQFLTESLMLAVAGAAAGFLFAVWSERLLVGMLSTAQNPIILDLHPDWRVLFFSTAVAISAGILFGAAPAFRTTRFGPAAALKERARNVRGGEERLGFGRALLGIQIALSVVLLATAGLFAGTLIRLLNLDMGFDANGLTILSIVNSYPPMPGPQAIELRGRLQKRARAIPGVESASLLWPTPLSRSGWDNDFIIPGGADLTEKQRDAYISVMGSRFTETMHTPLLAGRDFNDRDAAQSEPVALISENAARRWFPHGDALGSKITFGGSGKTVRIIGITANYRYLNLRDSVPQTVFIPYTQSATYGFIALRTKLPVSATLAAFRAILREEAPATPIGTIKTMRQQIDESLSTERLCAYLAVFIGALALLLTAVGLYGILAYTVTRRTGEIGIRMALGAQRASVVWLVVRQALPQIGAGLTVGVAAVLPGSRIVKSLLYGVRPNDPATIGAAIATLILVSIIAAWLPARRASRLDPMRALREE